MVHVARTVVATLLGLSLIACEHPSGEQRNEPALVVFPGATDVKRSNEFDGAVHYAVDDPYPGSQVIGWITESLEKLNWTEAEPVVKAQTPPGQVREWSRTREGDEDVFSWVGSWKNGGGDYVTYWLTYEIRTSDDRAVRMNVKAIRMSAATVKRLRESFERREK